MEETPPKSAPSLTEKRLSKADEEVLEGTVGEYDLDGWQRAVTGMYPGVTFATDGPLATAEYDGVVVSTYDSDTGQVGCFDQKGSDFFGVVGLGPEAELEDWQKRMREAHPGVEFRDSDRLVLAMVDDRVVSQFDKHG